MFKWTMAFGLVAGLSCATAAELHVAKDGDDSNDGKEGTPFLTIMAAAQVAEAGDEIVVHEGTYREWINPPKSGTQGSPIVYRAADDEEVYIKGSDHVDSWEEDGDNWKVTLNDADFYDFASLGIIDNNNPFKSEISFHSGVFEEEKCEWDCLGWLTYGADMLRGAVYLNNVALTQLRPGDTDLKEMSWYAEDNGAGGVTVYANFGDKDPNSELTEVNSRLHAVMSHPNGQSHITIKGLKIFHVGNHWSPPLRHQSGAIQPNGGSYWTIEDNHIMHVKSLGISIGVATNGSQGEGHHIIRNNIIQQCGQGGIAGQAPNPSTLVEGNIIEDINLSNEFGGWEVAGIKFHNSQEMVIKNNFIRGVHRMNLEEQEKFMERYPALDGYWGDNKTVKNIETAGHGIWIDYENINTTIAGNIIMDVGAALVALEANWGAAGKAILLSNNVFVSDSHQHVESMSSSNAVWVNNLFLGVVPLWRNQDFAQIRIENPTTYERWYNNMMVNSGTKDDNFDAKSANFKMGNNLYLDGSEKNDLDESGLVVDHETNEEINWDGFKLTLTIDLPEEVEDPQTVAIDASLIDLGKDDSFYDIAGVDLFGDTHSATPDWGPIVNLEKGSQKIVLFER